MWIIVIRPKDGMYCDTQYVGPFAEYMDAENALCGMPPASECDCKFIQQVRRFHASRFNLAAAEAKASEAELADLNADADNGSHYAFSEQK